MLAVVSQVHPMPGIVSGHILRPFLPLIPIRSYLRPIASSHIMQMGSGAFPTRPY